MNNNTGGHDYKILTYWEKLVVDYTGLNLKEVQELNYDEYLTLRRDAFIAKCSNDENGQKYLDNAWRLEQTKPDREKLREKFGGVVNG